ncbi:MAG: homocysteine S-methyltransferase family protein [Myxococcota bacterium]
MTILLDGPLGTELQRRGVDTRLPQWSARALQEAPEVLADVHRDYAAAGAEVHTTCTFRTRPATLGAGWVEAARRAVGLCRGAVPAGHRVAGSIAPLEDCYRPDLSPAHTAPAKTRAAHRALAEVLAESCDLLLCETFPSAAEARLAVEAAVSTGRETWLALTAGPDATLFTPASLAAAARPCVDARASVVLVNCTPARLTGAYVRALRAALPDAVSVGAYANAGAADEGVGWTASPEPGAAAYARWAASWTDDGAKVLGACCGTGPAHVRALREMASRRAASGPERA